MKAANSSLIQLLEKHIKDCIPLFLTNHVLGWRALYRNIKFVTDDFWHGAEDYSSSSQGERPAAPCKATTVNEMHGVKIAS